ncbi:MAG: hypothetical protein EBZ91_02325 [Gammaproteobacteria bacterium]|nr:hypothetical protein [Gammaproteobacteria bacterium]
MKVVSDKEIRVATLSGAVVLFFPGEDREVSDEIGLIALQLGARQVGSEPKAAPPVSKENPNVDEIEEVKSLDDVMTGIEKLCEVGDPEDFKADGTPKASAINRVVGRNVSPEDREAAWDLFIKS